MTKIYLIRHAEAEGNLYRIAHGQEEGLITDYRGPRQMQALARRFRDIPVDAVYASDLIRTQTTAQAVYVPKGLPLHLEPAFREVHMGVWEGLTWRQIETRWPLQMMEFNHQLDRWQVEGCETAQTVLDRYLPCAGWPGSMTARRWPFSPTARPCASSWARFRGCPWRRSASRPTATTPPCP